MSNVRFLGMSTYAYENATNDSDRLEAVLVEIRLAQRACSYFNHKHMVPRCFKDFRSLEDIQNHQRSLITEMRRLKELLGEDCFREISEKAERLSEIMIETTTSAGMGSFAQDTFRPSSLR